MATQPRTNGSTTMVGFDLGNLANYTGGSFVPDGDYILLFTVMMHAGRDTSKNLPARLGVMVDFYPMSDPREETKIQQFYSMGGKADQSFAPNPDTGKGIIPIPGAPATSLNDKTNWFMLVKSLYDSGLPEGILGADLSVLDGLWAHIQNVDEPEERKSFQSATAEVQQERRSGKVAVVSEILEGGAPWEGGGGLEAAQENAGKSGKTPAKTTPATAKAQAPAKTPAKTTPAARPAAKVPAAAPAAEPDEEDIKAAAINGISDVLTKKPNGCPRLVLRNDTFKAVRASMSEEMATSVISAYFENNDDGLTNLLGELNYTLQNGQIKPAA